MIGLIRQGFASGGLEADQPDRDRVSSDQGQQREKRGTKGGTNGLELRGR